MSLLELANFPVTSVSKKEERLSSASAAIAVIPQEAIRRSGARSIPELLRLAPGMQVARVNAHTWAVSARGFNDVFANKLLVLQDGRSIYTPLFSGTFWDVQDTLLEDIDRIEVIRGPGASLWGANAVNGVINIITKSAKETQGTLIQGGGGTEERGFGAVRYGDRLGENLYFRVYGTYFNRDDSVAPGGAALEDAWDMGRGGFRLDWDLDDAASRTLTLQGDLYAGSLGQTYIVPLLAPPYTQSLQQDDHVRGGNVIGRWTQNFAADSELRVQFYYDRTERETPIFEELRNTYDIDLQHRFPLGERHDVVWGLGYRLTEDEVGNSFYISLNPDQRTTQLVSAFVQDEISLVEDKLKLTLGSKFEHTDFTGFEVQPSARISWAVAERQTLWGSVARAVRTPSRAEDDLRLNQLVMPPGSLGPGSPAAVASVFGSRHYNSEDLLAFELGYRVQPLAELTFDLAAFYHDYDHLRTIETGAPYLELDPLPPHLVIPNTAANLMEGETYGIEASASWQFASWWRWQASYTYLQTQLHPKAGSADAGSQQAEGGSPHHQCSLRTTLDLPANVTLDAMLYYVDRLSALGIPSYVDLTVRLAWRPTPKFELAVVGHNLLDSQHPEYRPSTINTPLAEVERGVYGMVTWRF